MAHDLNAAIRSAEQHGGKLLVVGSMGWGCSGREHWYVQTSRVFSHGLGEVHFAGEMQEWEALFEDLDVSFSVTPRDADSPNVLGRSSPEQTFAEGRSPIGNASFRTPSRQLQQVAPIEEGIQSSTYFGFNWDSKRQAPQEETVSLLNLETDKWLAATLRADCVECFARLHAGFVIKFTLRSARNTGSWNPIKFLSNLVPRPSLYFGLSGSAELQTFIDFIGRVQLKGRTWDRTIAKLESPPIVFPIGPVPVQLTVHTRLDSQFAANSFNFAGSVRTGFGLRGKFAARVELNTKDWDGCENKLLSCNGVQGFASSLEITTAKFFQPPTFTFNANDASVVLRLTLIMGIKLYSTLTVEAQASLYTGTQFQNTPPTEETFKGFLDGALFGQIFLRPDEKCPDDEFDCQAGLSVSVVGVSARYKLVEQSMSVDDMRMSEQPVDIARMDDFIVSATIPLATESGMEAFAELKVSKSECTKFQHHKGLVIRCDLDFGNEGKNDEFRWRRRQSSRDSDKARQEESFFKTEFPMRLTLDWIAMTVVKNRRDLVQALTPFGEIQWISPSNGTVWQENEYYEVVWAIPEECRDTVSVSCNGVGDAKHTPNGQSHFVVRANGTEILCRATGSCLGKEQPDEPILVKVEPSSSQQVLCGLQMPVEGQRHDSNQDLVVTWWVKKGTEGKVSISLLSPSRSLPIDWQDIPISGEEGVPGMQCTNAEASEIIDVTCRISWMYLQAHSCNQLAVEFVLSNGDVESVIRVHRHVDISESKSCDASADEVAWPRRLAGSVNISNIFESIWGSHCKPKLHYAMFFGLDVRATMRCHSAIGGLIKTALNCPEDPNWLHVYGPIALHNLDFFKTWFPMSKGALYTCDPPAYESQQMLSLKLDNISVDLPRPGSEFFDKLGYRLQDVVGGAFGVEASRVLFDQVIAGISLQDLYESLKVGEIVLRLADQNGARFTPEWLKWLFDNDKFALASASDVASHLFEKYVSLVNDSTSVVSRRLAEEQIECGGRTWGCGFEFGFRRESGDGLSARRLDVVSGYGVSGGLSLPEVRGVSLLNDKTWDEYSNEGWWEKKRWDVYMTALLVTVVVLAFFVCTAPSFILCALVQYPCIRKTCVCRCMMRRLRDFVRDASEFVDDIPQELGGDSSQPRVTRTSVGSGLTMELSDSSRLAWRGRGVV
eukprot:TRINITY_DN30445_c0_g2_i1.p1 TRINITY_DN30445_c0_g2~~TRINITY_DN30445_c0_g2_i1.p1  ORF type:complete len:1356 (-),score=152.71 TRINITY_DN30445_c0_g2_i1:126-3650(-)